jgi:hypothetical protein
MKKVGNNLCLTSCRMKCTSIFNAESRDSIHSKFWKLTDTKKNHFYTQMVEKWEVKRKKKVLVNKKNRKSSYRYFFEYNNIRTRVCKTFFLQTLGISESRIYYNFDQVVDKESSLPRSPLKGVVGSRRTSQIDIDKIKQHIKSFLRVESQYYFSN